MDTTPEEAAQVVALLQQGLSQRAVAAQLHLSQSAVSRVYRRFQETGAFNRRPRTGRHRCTSERDDRFIVSTSLRNRHLTGVDVQQELRRVRQVAVSEWTVRRRLKEANLTPKRPASGPKLTAGHRQARLQFAREHLDWSIAQWRSVLFTDECRVCLHGSDRRGRVYRRPGERFAQCCFAETVAYGGGSCMMWAGISLEGKTALVFVPGGGRGGGLTADRYITDILLGHVVPYAEFVGEDFVLMHDNARCHTARVSRQFLREKELRTMDWPALSPDLNPIEHLWDELKRRVRARNPVPASVDELKTALLEEWDGIPQETVKKLIRYKENINMLTQAPSQRGPELKDVLAALTVIKSGDTFNLERAETLGDSFLKFAATLYLFHKFPQCNEGQLTNIKGRLIGNRNLYYAGARVNLGGRMKLEQFGPRKDFLVPGFLAPKELREQIEEMQVRILYYSRYVILTLFDT
ncbi:unnamed protein product [Plutella xylostella]|uniref:(diamondback moth) hypothetical protein n=1 Tax=Plutella xylostella TaxID=51655 RepID=A0A8S4G1H5_PLUXY|nr:unnamed protein product [Plutella xylostella]